jgi:branched-chain amino acid transport system permease protein
MEQIIVNGLYLGAQYALIALGLTLIFSLMNVLNFAHGQMYVLGGFVTYTVVAQFQLPFIVGLWKSFYSVRLSRNPNEKKAPCCSLLVLPSF